MKYTETTENVFVRALPTILRFFLASLLTFVIYPFEAAQKGTGGESRIDLKENWHMLSSVLVLEDAQKLTSPGFNPQGWYSLKLPSTVLTALVENGVYPDPYVGMNNMLIPDASEGFSQKYGLDKYSHLPENRNPWKDAYWFRTEFKLPEDTKGRHVWLNLAGIHYRAEVWLNGFKVADPKIVVGMFGDWSFEVTEEMKWGTANALALKIFPLDHPGLPGQPQLEAFGTFGLNGGETGDIGKNVTMQSAVGWDWIPAVRDRNMGIWQEIFISFTGPVDVRDPYVVTDLPLPELDRAILEVSAEVANLSSSAQTGSLCLTIHPRAVSDPRIVIRRSVRLKPHQQLEVRFTPDAYSELVVNHPRLWWPHNCGKPDLYELELRFDCDNNTSDTERFLFGIREVTSRVEKVDSWARRDFYINGKKILLRGGAWVPDMMLNRDPPRLFHELLLSQKANLNMVRIWGGGVTPPERFFSICDELGLLVWHDFWITGDCQGTWGKGSQDYPLEEMVFLKNAEDVVKRLRNHPSLVVWTAGNEGYPRDEIYVPLRNELLAGLDGTRPFLPSSGYREPPQDWGLSWPDNKMAGTYSGGPYHWVDPREYYRLVEAGKDWLFKNEVGLPSVPVLDSLKKFIPDLSPDPEVRFPLNHIWGYHDACEGNGKFSLYDQAIRDRYGEPKDLADYVRKAQLVNAEGYRGIFEAVNHGLDQVAGLLLWKTNPAWPSVVWQLYDWYLRPHAGYYFAKNACEPLHIQLNPIDLEVKVINQNLKGKSDLTAEAEVYGWDMQKVWEKTAAFDIASSSAQGLFTVVIPPDLRKEVAFVQLRLKTQEGDPLSENLYWVAADDDFTSLTALPRSEVKVKLIRKELDGDSIIFSLRFSNPTSKLAFFLNPSIRRLDSGEEVLPSFWSDNYFSILPGESKPIFVQVKGIDRLKKGMYLKVEGWNLRSFDIELED